MEVGVESLGAMKLSAGTEYSVAGLGSWGVMSCEESVPCGVPTENLGTSDVALVQVLPDRSKTPRSPSAPGAVVTVWIPAQRELEGWFRVSPEGSTTTW